MATTIELAEVRVSVGVDTHANVHVPNGNAGQSWSRRMAEPLVPTTS
ncbi:hypothetical protein B0E53_00290 [Micromonospora sp. MH33]|nr:hypothetical protein B0E53_00290 [Micromonospora sp. MH33]